MAIAIASNSAVMTKSANGATSLTVSYNATATSSYLVVFVNDLQGDTVTGVTYAGVAMSLLAKVSRGPSNIGTDHLYAYGLAAPTTGTNNIIASRAGTTNWIEVGGILFSGAQQTTSLSTVVSTQGGTVGSPKSQAITTTTDNSGVVGIMLNDNGSLAASTGITKLYQGAVGGTTTGLMIVRSTTFPYTPAGTLTANWTQNITGAWCVILVAVEPPSTANSNFLMFM